MRAHPARVEAQEPGASRPRSVHVEDAMSRVYVVHRVNDDLSPAEAFGRLVYVNPRYVYGDEIADDGTMPQTFSSNLASAAREFQPITDFLLIAGDHLQVMALSALLARRYRRFRVLRYDRQLKGYFPVVV